MFLVQPQSFMVTKVEPKQEVKPEPFKPSPINVPSFTPVGGMKPTTAPGMVNVARTLFTEGKLYFIETNAQFL